MCSSTDFKSIATFKTFAVFQCRECGLAFSNYLHNKHDLYTIYDDKYSNDIDEGFRPGGDIRHRDEVFYQISKFKCKGRILDIGCGSGQFLDLARRNGWDAYGVEVSEYAVRLAREKKGLEVIKGTIDNAFFPDEYFDIITMWDVIEHLENPLYNLLKIRELLKPQGILAIETPNLGSIYHSFLGKHWIGFCIYHVHYFNPITLQKMLKKAGFDIIDCITPNINFLSKEGLRRLRLYRYIYELELIVFKIKSIISKQFKKKIRYNKKEANFLVRIINTMSLWINTPINFIFEKLKKGDQLRIYARRPV